MSIMAGVLMPALTSSRHTTGFSLQDLVSYNDKHNETNGQKQFRRRQPQQQLELRRGRAYERSFGPLPFENARSETCC